MLATVFAITFKALCFLQNCQNRVIKIFFLYRFLYQKDIQFQSDDCAELTGQIFKIKKDLYLLWGLHFFFFLHLNLMVLVSFVIQSIWMKDVRTKQYFQLSKWALCFEYQMRSLGKLFFLWLLHTYLCKLANVQRCPNSFQCQQLWSQWRSSNRVCTKLFYVTVLILQFMVYLVLNTLRSSYFF